jgi:hypothetical protein
MNMGKRKLILYYFARWLFYYEQRTTYKPIFEGRRRQVKPIESIKELPESNRTINLIEPQDYAFPQGYEDYMLEFAVKKY